MNTAHHGVLRRTGTLARCFLAGVLWASAAPSLPASVAGASDPDVLGPVRAALRAGELIAAVERLETLLAGEPEQVDEASYLKALALFQAKRYAEAATAAEDVVAKFPDSAWHYKALFLKGRALIEEKRYEEAEAIYEAQALRLLSAERKHEIAGVIVGVADNLATQPDPDELEAPPADFQKAANLYSKALAMEIGRELRDEVTFKRARAHQQGGDVQAAVQELQAYLREYDPAWVGPAGLCLSR